MNFSSGLQRLLWVLSLGFLFPLQVKIIQTTMCSRKTAIFCAHWEQEVFRILLPVANSFVTHVGLFAEEFLALYKVDRASDKWRKL